MTYRIRGLDPLPFRPLFAMGESELEARGARTVVAGCEDGYPCRVSLRDAEAGERLILVNHVSHDAPTPYRASHAIFVREGAEPPEPYEDAVPELLDRRTIGLRGFDSAGMLCGALLALPGEADLRIRELLEREEIATIHAHNAAHGCFLAAIERN